MKRLAALLLLAAAPAFAQSNGWQEIQNGWGEMQTVPGYSVMPAPTGCVSTSVPFFGASVTLGCDGGITYDSTGRALTTETVKATSYAAQAKTVTITGATNATPIVVTATAHGLYTGDLISISGITGNTNANGFFKVTRLTADTFSLQNYSTGADIAGNGTYGGTPVAVTGIVQAQRVLFADGTAAAPSIALASDAGTGWFRPAANTLAFTTAGIPRVAFAAATIEMNSSGQVTWGNSSDVTATVFDTYITRGGVATVQFGSLNSATHAGVAQTLRAQSNITEADQNAPATFTIQAPNGTGTGTSGTLVFQAGTPQNAGTTAHVPATVLTLANTGTAGTAAPQALFANGTTAKPAIAFAGEPGTGIYWNTTGTIGLRGGGAAAGTFSNTDTALAPTVAIGFGADVYLHRPAAATLQLGAAASATPVAQTLQAQGATGTDVAGANLTIRPGAGTGAGTGSALIFQAPVAGSSGGGQQTYATRLSITGGITASAGISPSPTDTYALGGTTLLWAAAHLSRATLGSKSKALTDGSPVTFATFTIADGAMYSGEIIYNVKAVKGTDVQVLANKARFTAARVGTNYYVSVAAIGSDVASVSTGTLTCPISISGTGGVISLVATADTSFASPDSLVGQFRFDSPDAALALTFP